MTDKAKQCCGNCEWWEQTFLRCAWELPDCISLPSSYSQFAGHDHEGTACPCHKFKEKP